MTELFFHHDADTYLFDTNLLKLYKLDGSRSIEIKNSEIKRRVRLNSTEISREKAFKKVAERCHN